MKVNVKTEVKPVVTYDCGDVVVINEHAYIIFKERAGSNLKNKYSARDFDGRRGAIGEYVSLEELTRAINNLSNAKIEHYPHKEYELQLVKKEDK